MLSLIIWLFFSTAVWAESSCPICEMLFDGKADLIIHLVDKHPVRDDRGEPRKPGIRDQNPELAIIIPTLLNRLQFFSDYQREKREVWSSPQYQSYTLDINRQRIILESLDFGESKSFENCGSALLLLAVKERKLTVIKALLQNPENLANLDVVDQEGKNAFMLADKILESCAYGSEEYESWREIWESLSSLYRFAFFAGAPKPKAIADFFWPKHGNRQIEDYGWRPMDEAEATSLVRRNSRFGSMLSSPDWWGPCCAKAGHLGLWSR